MSDVINDGGLAAALDAMLADSQWATAKLKLFTNNVTPDNTFGTGSFTEATFTGYAAITLAAWGASSLSAHIASSLQPKQQFTITAGSQNIYGWYITNSAGTVLLASGRDPAAPVALNSAGMNKYGVTLTASNKDNAT